jgi:hypothetical protein
VVHAVVLSLVHKPEVLRCGTPLGTILIGSVVIVLQLDHQYVGAVIKEDEDPLPLSLGSAPSKVPIVNCMTVGIRLTPGLRASRSVNTQSAGGSC